MTISGVAARIALVSLSIILGNTSLPAQGVVQMRAIVSPTLPKYAPGQVISEDVKILGTDSLSDCAVEWDRSFRSFHPQGKVSLNPQVSAAAIQGFIQGTSTIVFSARDMSSEEATAFQTKNGYAPIRIPVCMDAIIVVVNKNNPINEISLENLDAIYSSTHLTGTKLPGEAWGELGAKGEWKKRNITPYSREEGAALRSWFGTNVLKKGGKFKETVQSRTDGMGMAEAVVTDPSGIAYSTMQSWFASVKVIPVITQEGKKAEPPTQDAVYAGKYPLVRSFYMFINRAPGKPLAPAYQEFAKYLLSSNGQGTLADTGFIPAPPDFILMGSKRLN